MKEVIDKYMKLYEKEKLLIYLGYDEEYSWNLLECLEDKLFENVHKEIDLTLNVSNIQERAKIHLSVDEEIVKNGIFQYPEQYGEWMYETYHYEYPIDAYDNLIKQYHSQETSKEFKDEMQRLSEKD